MSKEFRPRRNHLINVVLVIMLLFVCVFFASAQDCKKKGPADVPTYFPFTLGKLEITVIYDGNVDVAKEILNNVTPAELEELLARMYVQNPVPSSVNAFLINTGSKLILIDSGAGSLLGNITGYLPENLKRAGYSPWQIDAIFITHGHKDHLAGLLDANDRPVFPRATIYINKNEYEFWNSEANEAANTNPRFVAYFQLMQKTAPIFIQRNKWKTFVENECPIPEVPEIRTMATYGHTAGMTAFEITSEGKQLLIWSDITHIAAVQMQKPEVTIAYDLFPDRAIETRKAMLTYAATNRLFVAGSHLPFPGLGHVRMDEYNKFTWVPIEYAYKPATELNTY